VKKIPKYFLSDIIEYFSAGKKYRETVRPWQSPAHRLYVYMELNLQKFLELQCTAVLIENPQLPPLAGPADP
jgi:hypothetical protein